MNCLRYRERIGALESFHRYFHYAVVHEGRRQYFSLKSGTVRQCAAIVLSALYHALNDSTLAREATEEAIRIPQQPSSKTLDSASVAYALNWLYVYTSIQLKLCRSKMKKHCIDVILLQENKIYFLRR